jgi:hypothetical protein
VPPLKTRSPARTYALALPLLFAVASCASRARPSAAPPTPSNTWSAQTWEDHHDTMTFLILPNMAPVFQRFAQSPYPSMTCRTCHGADAEAVQYKMPHGLPALDPAHLPDAHDRDPRRARLAKFMIDEVTPRMADLLSVPRYDPRTKTGFSCFNCHPVQGTP